MSYTPTTWVTGDTITATKLNNIEQGIASAGGAFLITEDDGTLDKTWSEIATAIMGGQIAIIYGSWYEDNSLIGAMCNIVRLAVFEDGVYYVYLMGQDDSLGYSASSANGYLVYFD